MGERKPLVVAFLLVVSTVPWRRAVYYAGGVDSVVALKAVLSIAGLVLALDAARSAPRPHRLGGRSVWMLLAYLSSSTFGAVAVGDIWPSSVLSLRLLILATTVFLLLRAYDSMVVLQSLIVAMSCVAFVAALTGVDVVTRGGRLHGGIPPLEPNEVAFLSGIIVILLIWRGLHRRASRLDAPVIAFFAALVWLTGSRTGLVALIVAIAVIAVQARRWPVPAFVFAVLLAPVVLYAVFGLGLLSSYLGRGGPSNVGTLNNRTVAWSAAAGLYHTPWLQAFGGGLSVKEIPVAGQWWNTQLLDSSWVSALVQAGLIGIGLLGVWVALTVVSVLLAAPPERALWTALLAYVLLRSFLESGLLDATTAFCVFFLVSIASEATSRRSSGSPSRPTVTAPTTAASTGR